LTIELPNKMKRLLFLFSIFCVLTANAQNYLITFTGTGASNTVSSVKVENLTAGTTLTLNGSDILRLTITTGIKSIDDIQLSELKIYPNPMTYSSTLAIYPPAAGDATISVYNVAGKMLTQIQTRLDKGLQEFHLSGLESGSYLISVTGSTYHFSKKMLCNCNEAATINFERISNNQAVYEKQVIVDSKGVQATVDMVYNIGDRIKFTGISGNYSTIETDIPASNKTITFNFIACTDYDNNNYSVAEIGTQVWMTENLKTTKYLNGDLIGTTTPATLDISGESTPEYQWAYNGDESNVPTYGRLYTWYALTDSRNLCPTGWHVPTDAEWTTLTTFLGGESVAGGKLKETGTTHWYWAEGVTNESGFTALPGGFRHFSDGFKDFYNWGYWWSSTEFDLSNVYLRMIGTGNNVYKGYIIKNVGYSVRCLKNL
jgi:uncharacterized protein (TIGR02145 family)